MQGERYEWLSIKQHALKRPDTYAGGITPQMTDGFAFSTDEEGRLQRINVSANVSPALFKVVDETVQNAMDNRSRDPTQTQIWMTFDAGGTFCVGNNGRPIPLTKWGATRRYLVEVIFSELMSGENFDDSESRIGVGGRNGLGVKITALLSTRFEVEVVNLDESTLLFHDVSDVSHAALKERASVKVNADKSSFGEADCTVDGVRVYYASSGKMDADTVLVAPKGAFYNRGKLVYKQVFENNLTTIHPPSICRASSKAKESSTTVRYSVDLARLGMDAPLDESVMGMLRSRAYDAAACTDVCVSVDGKRIGMRTVKQYAAALGGAWIGRDIVQATSDGQACSLEVCLLWRGEGREKAIQVGFVNGIRCSSGTHMDCVMGRVRDSLSEMVGKKLKRQFKVTSSHVKERITMLVSARIARPTFTTQTKEKLENRADHIPPYTLSAAMLRSLEKEGVVAAFCDIATQKEDRAVSKSVKTDKLRVASIPKYERALKLGNKKVPCHIYITEGDSAKGLAVAGFSVIGREYNGVYSLRGKLANVNGMTQKKALEHKEILHLTQIMGLDPNVRYESSMIPSLPYQHMVIFTDQDNDGSHIMGLLLNWLLTFFPTLLVAHPTFVKRFATPIIRARIGAETRSFFSQAEYRLWVAEMGKDPSWVKYFKGLGTSTNEDAKLYFSAIEEHMINVRFDGETCRDRVDMWFGKSRSSERKAAIARNGGESFVDYGQEETTIVQFCDNELVCFGLAANERSLASAVDGLKPSQRKALYAALGRKGGEVKVAQLAASTAEMTAYHHGEASMIETIVHMAQPWMGANNVALLNPNGMFGNRHMSREEHSAPRYIFTEKNKIARFIFPEADDKVLPRSEDDGKMIEPRLYAPIVPMLLVNGSEGIGMGWRNKCLGYNMLDIIGNVRRLVHNPEADLLQMTPFFLGFKGSSEVSAGAITFKGVYDVVDERHIRITELPPKRWTEPYVEELRKSLLGEGSGKFAAEIDDLSTTDSVDILIKLKQGTDTSGRDLVSDLDLVKKVSLTDLNFWDAAGRFRTFPDVDAIMREHAAHRRSVYRERLAYQVSVLEHEMQVAMSRARYVREVNCGTIDSKNMTEEEVCAMLAQRGYYHHDNFEYIRRMGILSLTCDLAKKLEEQASKLNVELQRTREVSIEQVWMQELDQLEAAYIVYEKETLAKRSSSDPGCGTACKKRKKRRVGEAHATASL